MKKSAGIVPHPRYGIAPRPSGLVVSEDKLRTGFWRTIEDTIFPETALLPDPSKQNCSISARKYYVDILRRCRTCDRQFIFFAREQRYWFETLKFFVDADCVDCPVCRRESRVVQRRLRRYSDLFAKPDPSPAELRFLVDDAAYLLKCGALRNLHNVGAVKNRAMKSIPDYRGIEALVLAITAARQKHTAS